jgi:hypothetical protein
MKTILTVVYLLAAGLCVLAGWLYPVAGRWSLLAVAVLALHLVLGLIVAARQIADAGKIAAWCWQALSALVSVSLLLPYDLRQEGGWLLAAATMTSFTLIATLVICLVLKSAATNNK